MVSTAQADADIITELKRYKLLYEQERDQLEEFQRYSKELEAEMDMELSLCKKKVTELDSQNRKLVLELDESKKRYEKERNDFLTNENLLRTKGASFEEMCKDLRQKLRKIEQANDDLERRERIQEQELIDWATRYEKCLERCAYLEAGMFTGEDKMDISSADINSMPMHNGGPGVTPIASALDVKNFTSETTIPSFQQSKSFDYDLTQRHHSQEISEEDGFVSPPTSRMRLANGSVGRSTSSSNRSVHALNGICNMSSKESRKSSEIVSDLFRKIEEVERQVNPKKYVIQRAANHRRQT